MCYNQITDAKPTDIKGRNMGKIKSIHRITAAVLAAALTMLNGITAFSNTGSDYDSQIAQREAEIEQMRRENDRRQAEIDGYSGDISENEEMIALISQQIDDVKSELLLKKQLIDAKQAAADLKSEEISELEAEIEEKDRQIQDKQAEIAELNADNSENLKRFAKLSRALYINNTSDVIPLLNGSDDWYSFFVYNDVIRNISKQNTEFMQSLTDSINAQQDMISDLGSEIEQLESDKQALEDSRTQLESEMTALEQEKAELEQYAQEKYNALYKLSAENESLLNRVASLEDAINSTDDLIEKANREIEELIRNSQSDDPDQPVYSSDGFRWPLNSGYQYISTYFGPDVLLGKTRNHYGIDVGNAGIGGANVYAAQSGTVITAYSDGSYHGGYGNYVLIDHGGGISTLYAHCSSTTVYAGQTVSKGDVIGYVGSTGLSTGNHLHFEVRVNGVAVDPFGYTYEYV